MSEETKKWYVVRAISGKEKKVKQLIENEIYTDQSDRWRETDYL